MTIEQIELRKILTQMLADNGINRETIKPFVEKIIGEKVEKAMVTAVHEMNLDTVMNRYVRDSMTEAVQTEVRRKVQNCFASISISIETAKR